MSIEGQQLNGGRYHLLSLLSRSNTSEVYLAEDTQLSRQVAIKIILPETSAYPSADATVFGSRLFIREVEIIKNTQAHEQVRGLLPLVAQLHL